MCASNITNSMSNRQHSYNTWRKRPLWHRTRTSSQAHEDIADWDVSEVGSMSGMFSSAAAINGAIADWKISQFMSMSDMFLSADGLTDCLCLNPNYLPAKSERKLNAIAGLFIRSVHNSSIFLPRACRTSPGVVRGQQLAAPWRCAALEMRRMPAHRQHYFAALLVGPPARTPSTQIVGSLRGLLQRMRKLCASLNKLGQWCSQPTPLYAAFETCNCMKKALKDEWGTHGPIVSISSLHGYSVTHAQLYPCILEYAALSHTYLIIQWRQLRAPCLHICACMHSNTG